MKSRRWIFQLWLPVAVLGVAMALAFFTVNVEPEVESDFFFSTEDPALQSSQKIQALFPSQSPVILAATSNDPLGEESVAQVGRLTEDLQKLSGVARVLSLTSVPGSPKTVDNSPLWSRLLRGHDPKTSHLVVTLSETPGFDPSQTVARITQLAEAHQETGFRLAVSGVPFVVENIRIALARDLRVFSLAALGVFGLVILLLYRSPILVLGTLSTCITASLVTLSVLAMLDVPVGLLTANLATVVFVLTLSHTVFLTANWRRLATTRGNSPDIVRGATRLTWTASFWCMTTTLLGFGSLLLAHAKPLRELGVSGACGTLVAIGAAYTLYPSFLRVCEVSLAEASVRSPGSSNQRLGWVALALLATLIAGAGLGRLNTDPPLLEYFDSAGALRQGLATIDENLGSSPLYLVVSDGTGEPLDDKTAGKRLTDLQETLESDPNVGTALSIAVLTDEARVNPLARLLSWRRLIELLESERYDGVARQFITEDRTQALFALSMREQNRTVSRKRVVARLAAQVDSHGLRTDLVGGLYDLQGKLGRLVGSSLQRELGGLLLCFTLIAWIVSRSMRTAAAMTLCLATLPILLLGTLGHVGRSLDVISSPAINVAIALGVDAMIHLAAAGRRLRASGMESPRVWSAAIAQQRPAILGAMTILATGFALFLLSSFPPTRMFGGLVAVGMVLSAGMAIGVLPRVAEGGARIQDRGARVE